jgi:S-adenosylmethionine decarboxylase
LNLTYPEPKSVLKHTHIGGLHIIANFYSENHSKICEFQRFKDFIEEQITSLGLRKIGEVYHNFPGGGYTGVVCLTESHLSIHTWPERNYVTFDVFLSNYLRDNRPVTRTLYKTTQEFFQANVLFEQIIDR